MNACRKCSCSGGRRVQVERIDGDALLPKAELQVAALEQRGQLAVAVPEVEHDGERVVLLQVRDEEVQQEALAAARRAQHQRVPHVVDMQVVRSTGSATASRTPRSAGRPDAG